MRNNGGWGQFLARRAHPGSPRNMPGFTCSEGYFVSLSRKTMPLSFENLNFHAGDGPASLGLFGRANRNLIRQLSLWPSDMKESRSFQELGWQIIKNLRNLSRFCSPFNIPRSSPGIILRIPGRTWQHIGSNQIICCCSVVYGIKRKTISRIYSLGKFASGTGSDAAFPLKEG